tara:strand:+ start:8572 stop:9357 length:786 start_codon:yes stop_codon:yes gene_type:complete
MATKQRVSDKTVLFPDWDRKERVYIWAGDATPVSESLQSRHTRFNELQYFDEEQGYPRSLRYVTNQTTFFEDEQVEPYVLAPIIFEDGKLTVKANQTVLQQFLAIHPHNKENGGYKFYEYDANAAAAKEMKKEELAFEAMETFFAMGIEDLEPIGRVMIGNIDRLASNELKRDLLIKVKADPQEFLNLANNSDIKMKNLTLRLIDANVIKFKDDNVTVVWAKNGKEVVKVPFSANPIDMFSKYLKTDEGLLLQEGLLQKLG